MDSNIPLHVKEYFEQGRREIVNVIPRDNYTLEVTFDNNEVKIYDMSDKLTGVFNILRDLNRFREVFLDESGNIAWDKDKNIDSNVVWNNRLDICADAIYLDSKPQ